MDISLLQVFGLPICHFSFPPQLKDIKPPSVACGNIREIIVGRIPWLSNPVSHVRNLSHGRDN